MKAMSPRQLKVAEVIRHVVAMALVRAEVPSTLDTARLTVAEVWVSPDLKLARLFVQLPADWPMDQTLATANAELAKPLRHVLAKALVGKSAPQVELVRYGS